MSSRHEMRIFCVLAHTTRPCSLDSIIHSRLVRNSQQPRPGRQGYSSSRAGSEGDTSYGWVSPSPDHGAATDTCALRQLGWKNRPMRSAGSHEFASNPGAVDRPVIR